MLQQQLIWELQNFNPIIGLILFGIFHGQASWITNFNPIIGLILFSTAVRGFEDISTFQSHYRSDFIRAKLATAVTNEYFNPIIGLILLGQFFHLNYPLHL